ncbi:MAG: hypothetical protein GW949_03225 [Spirochaetales bacterium]|nr:hypothetical protein [Spirochaetales bacterium]
MPRDTECPQCRTDVRCCMNCRFYSPGSKWECRETIPDPVYDKERRNFCEYFDFRTTDSLNRSGEKEEKARKALNTLFGSLGSDE